MEGLQLQSSKKPSTRERQKRKNENRSESPFEILCACEEQINPAILLAEELMRKGMAASFDVVEIERAEAVLILSREEISRIENQLTALIKTPPAPATLIPVGF